MGDALFNAVINSIVIRLVYIDIGQSKDVLQLRIFWCIHREDVIVILLNKEILWKMLLCPKFLGIWSDYSFVDTPFALILGLLV